MLLAIRLDRPSAVACVTSVACVMVAACVACIAGVTTNYALCRCVGKLNVLTGEILDRLMGFALFTHVSPFAILDAIQQDSQRKLLLWVVSGLPDRNRAAALDLLSLFHVGDREILDRALFLRGLRGLLVHRCSFRSVVREDTTTQDGESHRVLPWPAGSVARAPALSAGLSSSKLEGWACVSVKRRQLSPIENPAAVRAQPYE
jgi:hypothetical protein